MDKIIYLAAMINGVIVEEIKFQDESQIAYWKQYLLSHAPRGAVVYRKL